MNSKRINKPWGHEIIFAHTDMYVGKILHINAGQALSLQYHNTKDETIMVQFGRIQIEYFKRGDKKNRKVLDMVPGDTFHILPGIVHRMIACQDAEIVEVSTPELDDIVRLEDRYGRGKNDLNGNKNEFFLIKFLSWVRSIFKKR